MKNRKFKRSKVWGTGKPKREFMYVDDSSVMYFLLQNNVDYELINSGTGKEITIKEFSELMKKAVGFKGKITFDNTKPDGTLNKRLDTSIINKQLET